PWGKWRGAPGLFVGAGLEVGFRTAGRLGQLDHVFLRYRTDLLSRLWARRLGAVDNHAQSWRPLGGWVSGRCQFPISGGRAAGLRTQWHLLAELEFDGGHCPMQK